MDKRTRKNIKESINKSDYLLEKWYDNTYNIASLQHSAQFDEFINMQEVLIEFGMDAKEVEEYLSKNFKKIEPAYFYQKCLVSENFKHLEYYLMHPALFRNNYSRLFALEKFYSTLSDEQQQKTSFISFTAEMGKSKQLYGYTYEEMLAMYPLTDQKLQNMERIHQVKKAAREKARRR